MANALPQEPDELSSPQERAMLVNLTRGAGVGVVWFALAVVLLHLIQRGEYDAVEQAVSDLALGRYGFLMTSAFITLGAGELVLAVVLWRSVERARVGPILLAILGLTGLLSAVFETDPTGAPNTTHGAIHNGSGLVGFLLVVPMLLSFSWRFHHDPQWRSSSVVTLVWAVAAAAAFVFLGIHAEGDMFGLAQKIFIVVWISWYLAVVAWILFKAE